MKTTVVITFCMGVALSTSAQARPCVEYENAKKAVLAAHTKDAVAVVLIGVGASAEAAENVARSSPDLEVAQSVALNALTKALATCAPK